MASDRGESKLGAGHDFLNLSSVCKDFNAKTANKRDLHSVSYTEGLFYWRRQVIYIADTKNRNDI